MTNLKKYTEGNLSDKELDAFSKKLITAKLDRDKKKEWEQKLKENYGLTRTKSKRRFLLPAIAASLLLALSLWAIPFYTNPNYLSLVEEEINQLSIMGDQSIIRKGKQNVDEMRKEAALAYVDKKYEKSISLWLQINAAQKLIETDCFYLGLSYLKKENPNPAQTIFWLEQARERNATRYQEEIAWVLALAYLKNGEQEKASLLLKKISQDYDYKAAKAKEVLELLE